MKRKYSFTDDNEEASFKRSAQTTSSVVRMSCDTIQSSITTSDASVMATVTNAKQPVTILMALSMASKDHWDALPRRQRRQRAASTIHESIEIEMNE